MASLFPLWLPLYIVVLLTHSVKKRDGSVSVTVLFALARTTIVIVSLRGIMPQLRVKPVNLLMNAAYKMLRLRHLIVSVDQLLIQCLLVWNQLAAVMSFLRQLGQKLDPLVGPIIILLLSQVLESDPLIVLDPRF